MAMQDDASLAGCHLNSWHMASNWSSPCWWGCISAYFMMLILWDVLLARSQDSWFLMVFIVWWCLVWFFLFCVNFPCFFSFWCFFVSCATSHHCPILYPSLVTVGLIDVQGELPLGFLSFHINEDCVAANLSHKHGSTSLSPGVATKANLAWVNSWKNTMQFWGPNSSQLRLGPSQASTSRGSTSLLGHHRRPQAADTVWGLIPRHLSSFITAPWPPAYLWGPYQCTLKRWWKLRVAKLPTPWLRVYCES